MTSYRVDQKDLAHFLTKPSMNDQEGIMFAYATDETVLKSLIPAPLKLVAPIIVGYVVDMGKPTFGGPYLEETLYAMVSYQDKLVGAYPFQLLLSGPGAEAGLISGREGASIPKKLADEIVLRRTGNQAVAKVTRHGKVLLDLSWESGAINEKSFMAQFSQMMTLGKPMETNSFFFDYHLQQDDEGKNHFVDVTLLATKMKSVADRLEPGKLTLKLDSTEDDPLGELRVIKPLGAAWYHFKTSTMYQTLKLEKVDDAATAPYLVTGRYDRSLYDPEATSYHF